MVGGVIGVDRGSEEEVEGESGVGVKGDEREEAGVGRALQ